MMELTSDSLKLEEELEFTINSDMDVNSKTTKIKELLFNIATIEISISKFTSMVSTNQNNNEIKN